MAGGGFEVASPLTDGRPPTRYLTWWSLADWCSTTRAPPASRRSLRWW